MGQLKDKVAIVVGASSGIGRAAAKLFAEEGARLVVGARRRVELDGLVEELGAMGADAVALDGDVVDESFAAGLVELAVERFGGLDVAFDNAGTLGEMAPLAELSAEGWERTMGVNLTGAFYLLKHQLPALAARGGGSVVVTSTFVGHTAAMAGMGAYAASKAGVLGLVRTAAVEGAAQGVRVNALLPGGTDTPMGRAVASSEEALSYVSSLHALGRIAEPEEIARAALFLASEASSFVTGSVLLADGGVSIHRA